MRYTVCFLVENTGCNIRNWPFSFYVFLLKNVRTDGQYLYVAVEDIIIKGSVFDSILKTNSILGGLKELVM